MCRGGQRSDVQQISAVGHDLVEHSAIGSPSSEQVDADRPFDCVRRRFGEGADLSDACVRNRDIDPAEAGNDLLDRVLEGCGVSDIDAEPDGALAQPVSQDFKLSGVKIEERDVGAARVQTFGGRGADPTGGTGDHHRASAKGCDRRSAFGPA